jgi:hypothetical protein
MSQLNQPLVEVQTDPLPKVVTGVEPRGGVVVGDDGSLGAELAVRYAIKEARRRQTTLHVVQAWSTAGALRAHGLVEGHVPSVAKLEASVREGLRVRVRAIMGAKVMCRSRCTRFMDRLLKLSSPLRVGLTSWLSAPGVVGALPHWS